MKALLEKCMIGKPSTKELALGIFIHFFSKGMKEDVFAKINAAIVDNLSVPKFVVGAYEVIQHLLEKYGPQKMDMLKPFIPSTLKACASTKPGTKDAAMSFIKECLNWIGQAFLSLIDGLNKVQVKTLEDYLKDTPCPNKALKKGGGVVIQTPGGAAGGAGEDVEEVPNFGNMDAYELATAVDIFKTYNEAFFDAIIALPKWNEKKAKLDEFLQKAAKTPKFANSNISWISNIVKRLFMDPNAVVTKTTFAVLGACAKGLRKNFSSIAKKEVGGLLLKFKDKKMADDIFQMLSAFEYCMKPSDVTDDIKVALKEKQLEIKNSVTEWIIKACKKDSEETERCAERILPVFIEMTEEGDKGVRENVSKFIALTMIHCGEDKYAKLLTKVKPEKMRIIQKLKGDLEKDINKEANAVAEVQSSSKGPASPKKVGGKTTEATVSTPAASTRAIPEKAAAGPGGAKAAAKKVQEDVQDDPPKKSGGKNIIAAQNESTRLPEPNMTFEEVEGKLKDMDFEQSVLDGLASNTWEVKRDALGKAFGWLADNAGFSEEFMILLRHSTKNFNFPNPNFNKDFMQGLMNISEDMDCKKKLFNEPNIRLMLEFCIERFNEKMYLPKIQDLLIRACSLVSPKAIISTMIDLVKKKTLNPKICESLNDILEKMIFVLTAANCPVADLIEFAKFTFGQAQASVKKVGYTIICKLYANIGPKIKDYLSEVNENIMKTVDAELKKVTVNLKASPTIEIFGVKGGAPASDTTQVAPTADISTSLNGLIPNLEHSSWQNRKDALDNVLSLLADASYNIKANNLDGFVNAIVKTVEDPHKTPRKVGIEVAGALARSLGKGFKPWVKIILPVLVKNLLDKQAAVREETLASINLIYENVESERESCLREMLNSLSHDSVELKQEALNFLDSHSEDLSRVDYKNAVELILKGLESKSKPIRDGFEQLLKKSIEAKGEEIFSRAAKSLNPVSSKAALALMDRIAGRASSELEVGDRTARGTSAVPKSRDASVNNKRDGAHHTPHKEPQTMGERSKSTNALPAHPVHHQKSSEHLEISSSIPLAGVMMDHPSDQKHLLENANKVITNNSVNLHEWT